MTLSKNNNGIGAPALPCPICDKPGVQEYEPFCSKRCADVDLHRWLSEGYAIPAVEDDSDGTSMDQNEKGD